MKSIYSKSIFSVLVLLLCFACKEEIDTSARYVFKIDSVWGYLEKHDAYSEYVRLLQMTPISIRSQSTVGQLLSARGHFTVFAPTNDAIAKYLQELYEEDQSLMSAPSIDAFYNEKKRDSICRVIVCNSIIDSGDHEEALTTNAFPQENGNEFPLNNMNDRKLSVKYKSTDSIFINNSCPINLIQRDILLSNGVIHQMERVIAPKDVTAAKFLQEILNEEKEGFLVMAKAIQACGLMDTLSKIRDEVYENLYLRGEIPETQYLYIDGHFPDGKNFTPRHRLYGFTIFAETDDYWRTQGLDPHAPSTTLLPQLIQWIINKHQYSYEDVYTTDENYEQESNLLYQWTTYHILPFRAPADRLVFHRNEFGYTPSSPYDYKIPMYEIYTTMGKRRLLKIYESKESNGVYLNRFPVLDNGRHSILHELSCPPENVGCFVDKDPERAILNDIINCCIYPIDAPLSYNDAVRDNLAKQRLRFDGMTLFPEAMNNEIRLKLSSSQENQDVYIPNTQKEYNYFENMQMNNQTVFIYLNAYRYNWCNLHSDEMKAKKRFEITFKLPPVPRRTTYEFRYDVLPNGDRGIQQFYFGDDPARLPAAGIPVNLTRGIGSMNVGYEKDSGDDDYDAEVDKRLRNNGVMKGAKSVTADGNSDIERDRNSNLRYIIIRQTLDPDKTYYMKVKSVLDSEEKEFYMDYMEYCPKEVYDNPEHPEDIW